VATATTQAGQYSWGGIFRKDVPLRDMNAVRNTAARDVLRRVQAGTMLPEEAIRWAERTDFRNVNISQRDFMDAVVRSAEAPLKERTAGLIDQALNSKSLPPQLMQTSTRTGGGSPSTASAGGRSDAIPSENEIKRVRAMTEALAQETAQRAIWNDKVAAGTVTAEQAAEQLAIEQKLRPLLTKYAEADAEQKGALAVQINHYRKALKEANDEDARSQSLRRAGDIRKATAERKAMAEVETTYANARLQAMKGLNGEPLEQQLRLINLEEQKALVSAQEKIDLARLAATATDEERQAIIDAAEEQRKFLDEKARWEEQAAAVAMMKEQVDALGNSLGNALSQLGGIGGGLGQALNALTSNNPVAAFAGMGGVGTLGAILLAPKILGKLGSNISSGLQSLGLGAGFSGTAGKLLGGAGVGSIAGGLTGSSVGGALGGAAGSVIGSSIKALGKLGGPIGSIVGGLLGGLLGSIFKKAKTGSASITDSGIVIGGNNADLKGQVGTLGSNLQGGIASIAQALGASVGQYAVSVGIRNKEFRVSGNAGADVTGKNPRDLLYRGQDAEQAAMVALRNAIADGAIKGISETIKRLLLSGSNIDAQVAKAQQLQAALASVAQAEDPVGYALKELAKQIDQLRAIAAEAGATTEELAAIEKLAADQRKAILDQAKAFIDENFYSDVEKLAKAAEHVDKVFADLNITGVTTVVQFRELVEGIDLSTDAGTKLYGQLLAIAPEFLAVASAVDQVQAAAEALAEQNRQARLSLTIDLLRAQGRASEALAMERANELAAMDASLRPLQALVWAWQDAQAAVSAAAEKVSAAQSALSAAYQRQAGELDSMAQKWRGLSDSMRSYRQSLNDMLAGGSTRGNLVRYLEVAGNARAGNEAAIGQLQGAGMALAASALQNAGSAVEYNRTLAMLRRDADAVAKLADGRASAAEAQAMMLKQQVAELIGLNEKTQTVAEAIDALKEAQAELDKAQADRDALTNPVPQLQQLNIGSELQVKAIDELRAELAQTRYEIEAMRGDAQAGFTALDAKAGTQLRLLQSWDGGAAVKVMTDTGDTLSVNQVA
ncbi:MAG: hypothetical protein RIS17_586, partial [Pseudomonadota bacterium]